MAPRTRRSQAIGHVDHTQGQPDENQTSFQNSTLANRPTQAILGNQNVVNMKKRKNPPNLKRTLPLPKTNISTNPSKPAAGPTTIAGTVAAAVPAKRARYHERICGKPMPLELSSGDETEVATDVDNRPAKGKQRQGQLRRTPTLFGGGGSSSNLDPTPVTVTSFSTSFPPAACPFTRPDIDAPYSIPANNNEDDIETEEDWVIDQQLDELEQVQPSKFSEAIAKERPVWDDPLSADDPSGFDQITSGSYLGSGNVDMSQASNAMFTSSVNTPRLPDMAISMASQLAKTNATPMPTPTPTPALNVWPASTDVVLTPGSTRVMLTVQHKLLRQVIQDSFKNVRAALMFQHAFPNAILAPPLIKDALLAAADSHKPAAASIYQRLMCDANYLSQISVLPYARFCTYRGEVKERVNALVQAEFLAIGTVSGIADSSIQQTLDYNYTYPVASNGLLWRSKPYRNPRIVKVIQEVFFTGVDAFATHFNHLFLTHLGPDGEMRRELPIPMVALVATALYAALHEWRSGMHQAAEFSANTYMDVYKGHIGTFNHIKSIRESSFHLMMADLYTKASAMLPDSSTVPIAQVDFEELEG